MAGPRIKEWDPLMMLRLVVLAGALSLSTAPVFAQRGASAPATRPVAYLSAAQLKELNTHIEQARQQWKIPGLALAIVQRDSVVFAKGYGVKVLGKPATVDENTLFAIGSSGKSMTAAVVSMLVDEGKMKLDDPIWRYLPNFRVADPYVSREATMRDALSHRTSLDNSDMVWYGAELTRAQVIERMRYLKGASFRSRFAYNNMMLMVAGEAAAAAAGKPWEQLVKERLLQPLGMSTSLSNPEEIRPQSNVATPHMNMHGTLVPIPHRNTRNIAPAGGEYSSAREMAQYLRFQLGNGVYNGKRLVSEASMAQMRSLISTNGVAPVLTDSTSTGLGYGLGWFIEFYRGRRLLRHGGAIDGMLTEMMLLPEEQIGVVVLTNFSPHTMHTALTNHIFDVALGLPQRDWNGQAYARLQAQLTQAGNMLKSSEAQRGQGGSTLPIEKYAGTYSDSLFGSVRIAVENGGLVLHFRPGFVAKLEPWQYNSFRVDWQTASVLAGANSFATFTLDSSGRPIEVRIDALGTFQAPQAGRGGRGGGN